MTGKVTHLGKGSQEPPLTDKLRLYALRFCPYSHRVNLILSAKEIPHDVVYVNLRDKPEWYVSKYPAGKVPAVLVNDVFISESLIITDFLDEYFPSRKLHNSDPIQKAKDRLVVDSFSQVMSHLYKCFTTPTLTESLLTPVFDSLDKFEKELSSRDTPFFFGPCPGMVDYMMWPWFERIPMLKVLGGDSFAVPKDRFPKLISWSLEMLKDPAVQTWAISPENHAKFMKTHQTGNPDFDNIL